jgi:phosphomannomutase/phosphoglucomutase
MQGVLKGGVDVIDCGVVPTPALLFALKDASALGGVMVSGSHTPAETAGILFFLGDTGEMDSQGEMTFENLYHSEPWRQTAQEQKGSLQSAEIIEDYLGRVEETIGHIEGFKAVVDPGNGATCSTLAQALERFGCSVVTINGEPDGRFLSRPPNPQPSTLSQLSKVVRETKADFGLGTDSDGDRAIFVTTDGQVQWGDLTSALFTRMELAKRHGGTIVTTVNTSSMLKVLCQEQGAQLRVTRVGPPAMAEALRTVEHVIFATEGESGKNIWPDIILYGDAALAAGKLLHGLSEYGMNFEQLVDALPRFYELKSALECEETLKPKVMKIIADVWKEDGSARTSSLDGLKVEYPDLTWFLIRASGTEPLLRCGAEGRTMTQAKMLLGKATALALEAMRRANEAVQP